MKLLCYADLQATDGNEICFTKPTVSLQHYRVEKFFSDLRAIYDQHQCDGIIDLGDTTDDRSSIPVPTIEAIGSGLEQVPDSMWNIKLIGNHEQYLRNATVNVRRLFDHKFHVVSENEIFDLDGLAAFFCSYPADYTKLTAFIRTECHRYKSMPQVLFGHFQVAGCATGSGTLLQGLSGSTLHTFSHCLLGHIHLPQSLNDRIHYVGSPFQQDWGEAGQSKRVGVFDSQTRETTWVPLKGYPEYHVVNLEEFKKAVQENSEDRFRVVLNSHDETEEFYRHPLFSRHPAVFNYSEVETEEPAEAKDWSLEGVCERYLKTIPPKDCGVDLTPEEMIDLGVSIARGEF
jgi:hypothetical protein